MVHRLIVSLFFFAWVRNLIFESDTCGGASMLPKDKGGVVDPQLKVSIWTD
jgi:hypothetical protein